MTDLLPPDETAWHPFFAASTADTLATLPNGAPVWVRRVVDGKTVSYLCQWAEGQEIRDIEAALAGRMSG